MLPWRDLSKRKKKKTQIIILFQMSHIVGTKNNEQLLHFPLFSHRGWQLFALHNEEQGMVI